jgi:predicted regulator of Ras-like GTPase activity (Roadblock/LC7/MglB family)
MLSSEQIKQLQQQLLELLERCQAIDAAVVVTVDGYTYAMQQRQGQKYQLERVATMGSTLMSLGDTMTAELNMGTCDNIIAENKHGIVAFMHINDDLVLVALTGQKNAYGLLLSHSRKTAERMAADLCA